MNTTCGAWCEPLSVAAPIDRRLVCLPISLRCLHGQKSANPWRALLVDGNPTNLIEINKLMPSDYEEERSRILSPGELLELHKRFQQMTIDYSTLPAGQKYEGIRP